MKTFFNIYFAEMKPSLSAEKRKKQKQEQRKIAESRIRKLFVMAEEIYKEDLALANRYVELAWKISLKSRVRIPKDLRTRFCKHCLTYFVPDVTCRVRLGEKRVIYYCLKCNRYRRFPYVKEIKEKRRRKEKQK